MADVINGNHHASRVEYLLEKIADNMKYGGVSEETVKEFVKTFRESNSSPAGEWLASKLKAIGPSKAKEPEKKERGDRSAGKAAPTLPVPAPAPAPAGAVPSERKAAG